MIRRNPALQSAPSLSDDVILIGAGHNGLITAAYLAQAGYRVRVFERRPIVGGAVSTHDFVPGYQFDLGGSAHILIRLTPIVEELGLASHGLRYLEVDPLFFAPFEDGTSLTIYRDLDQTVEAIEAAIPGEGEAYRRFCADWRPFSETVRDAFLSTPSPFDLGRKMIFGRSTKLNWKQALGSILRPYGDVVSEYFRDRRTQALVAWMAAQSGPPPTEPLGGPFALWHPLYHVSGVARPVGGSGGLTRALRRHIEAHGGTIHTGTPVSEIRCERGRVVGVVAEGETYRARAVVAATHAVETFAHLLPEAHRPAGYERMRVGNGFGAILRLALDRPVRYAAKPDDEARVGLGMLCESIGHINRAYGEFLAGQPSTAPPLVAMSFSAVDDTLTPPGGEVLWLWGQYFPYALADGQSWARLAPRVADSLLDQFERYAPGTRASVVGQLFQHPEWLEQNLGLYRGNVMHLEMSIDQMFVMRPMLGLANYRAHLKGLYLTGASTHPGGGIMGASGRNAARVVLRDLDRKKV